VAEIGGDVLESSVHIRTPAIAFRDDVSR